MGKKSEEVVGLVEPQAKVESACRYSLRNRRMEEKSKKKFTSFRIKVVERTAKKRCRFGIFYRRKKYKKDMKEVLHGRIKSFISSMHLVQGQMQFSQWKCSVMDSIGGAYLTQNTNDTISSSTFISLAARFPHRIDIPFETSNGSSIKTYYSKRKLEKKICHALDWEAVTIAQVGDISKVIQKRGMNNNLAARLKNCLNKLSKDFGSIDNLESLRDFPPDQAKEYLLSIHGLGLKSVECIRLLTLQHKAFPIDTNAGRVAVRLGWVPVEPLPSGQEFHLLDKYPDENSVQMHLWPLLSELDWSILYELHCQMITFAKAFCTKKNPNCSACPMTAECKHYMSAQLALKQKECAQLSDIEDFGLNGNPSIKGNGKKLKENIRKFINTYSRTEHQVYVLPDSHPLLTQLKEIKEANDLCPYLLAIWSLENLNKDQCLPEEDMVCGTLLIPVRTAMKGIFPLNGTFFQVNEVFADDESTEVPINVPKVILVNLQQTTLYCGMNMSAICKGMTKHQVQKCFSRGYVCFRGFNTKIREPKSLSTRFHLVASEAKKVKKGQVYKQEKLRKNRGT